MDHDWIKDKVIIVTGGASGIGEAIAKLTASKGAKVVIADINDEKGESTVAAIEKADGFAKYIATDVTDAAAISDLVAQARRLGQIKFLVNSAGLQTYGTVESTSEVTWDKTMNINLKSMYLVAHEVVPEILKHGGGAIVNISSVQAIRSQKNVLAYATSKAGAVALTRCMGLDYAEKGIQVNCICPGSVDTPLLRYGASQHGETEAVLKEWGSHHPIGRIGTPEEIAQVALFLMSPASAFMVGQAIVADGGLGSVIL